MRRFLGVPALLFVAAVAACSDEPMAAVDGGADAGNDAAMDAGVDAGRDATASCSSPADCDDAVYCNGVETCAPGTAGADGRGCVAGTAPCATGDMCMEATGSCRGCTNLDADADGVTECDGDCDDADVTRFPGATEVCDTDDEDCNDTTVGTRDDDVDGYVDVRCCNTATTGSTTCGLDCDDALGGVHPSVPEVCNGYDDDCDGDVDEGVLSTFYRDADEDDYGIASMTTEACMRPAGYTDTTTFDCDDADSARNPGLAEICNDRDDDCDPATNPWDVDLDGYDDLECGGSDCNDASVLFHPGLSDPCDGVDVDCSTGRVGEDGDMDGHAAATDTCTAGSIPRDDCNDLRGATYPSAPETCNGIDDDCDGAIDGAAAQATCAASLVCSSVCSGVVGLSLGQLHSCALTSSGTVLCWGDNANSKLGDGTTIDRAAPVAAAGVAGALEVSAGGNHTCARTATGVLCWGHNVSGQLGDGSTTTRSTAVSVVGLGVVAQLATGFQHSCARTTAGAVWCWGSNANGQVGDGTATSRATPTLVTFPISVVVAEIAAGGGSVATSHTCARTSTGTVYCWGSNGNGQAGDGTTSTARATPVAVVGLSDAIAISASAGNTCALRAAGSIVCWGNNASGQIGDGTTTSRLAPTAVTGLLDATAISAGNGHVCALSASRGLLCWGNNMFGQLGTGMTGAIQTAPVSPISVSAVEIAADGTHTCARRADGAVYCWGANGDGRVGDGTTSPSRPAPTPVLGAS